MIESFNHRVELEIREDERLGKMLHATILQEGRARVSPGRSLGMAWSGLPGGLPRNGPLRASGRPASPPSRPSCWPKRSDL